MKQIQRLRRNCELPPKKWTQRGVKSSRAQDNEKLLIEIRRVFLDNHQNYGSPRVWDELNNEAGIKCSENRVSRRG